MKKTKIGFLLYLIDAIYVIAFALILLIINYSVRILSKPLNIVKNIMDF